MASEVDLQFDRKNYKNHDSLQLDLDPLNTLGTRGHLDSVEHMMFTLRETVIREKPKWSSHTLIKV